MLPVFATAVTADFSCPRVLSKPGFVHCFLRLYYYLHVIID